MKGDEQTHRESVVGECTTQTRRLSGAGYGFCTHNGKRAYSHRVAYCLANGLDLEAIKGKLVRHLCNNPPCINPDHLVLGSQKDNMDDRERSGHTAYGERNGNVKLPDAAIDEIRTRHKAGGVSCVQLAAAFGVSSSYVSKLTRGIYR